MHKIFGEKENVKYIDREGAYLNLIKNDSISVIQTSKGYFLLGGGLENGESHIGCIKRECIEESRYDVCIKEKYVLKKHIASMIISDTFIQFKRIILEK